MRGCLPGDSQSASPHEQAWRDALSAFADPVRFTSGFYQDIVAGKPRNDGALAALQALGVPDAGRLAQVYAERKQARLEQLVRDGHVEAFPDALRFVEAVRGLGWKLAVASSSKRSSSISRCQGLPTRPPQTSATCSGSSGSSPAARA